MFLLFGLPSLGIDKYRPACVVPCAAWQGGGSCVVEFEPAEVEAAESVPEGCSDSAAIDTHNLHVGETDR